ncbi:MAG: polysaccharide deacetylase family protein [Chitinophagaceae bacterium]|nr:MAG: polysaccharide deacetylase family protein [Chitinophagaceae bacterium]
MAKVLMFHRVLPEKLITQPNAYTTFGTLISQEYFETVLSLLTENNFEFVSISELAQRSNSEKLIALTFDDGYLDNFDFAFPSLKKFNATATFFPVVNPCKDNSVLPLDIYYQCVDEMALIEIERTAYITGQTKRNFYWAEPDKQMTLLNQLFKELPENCRVNYMSADQLKELVINGFEIGSHGMTHALMIAEYMNEEKALNELQNSKQWLEAVTGKLVNAYCFPAGRYNAKMIELAKQVGYTSTCLVVRNENEKEVLPSYDRIFVKPNSLGELKTALEIE